MWSSCSEELVGRGGHAPFPPTRTHLSRIHLPMRKDSRGKRAQMHVSPVPSRGRPPPPRDGGSRSARCELRPPARCIRSGGVSAHNSQRGAQAFSAVFKAQLRGRSRQKRPFPGAQPGVCLGKVLNVVT